MVISLERLNRILEIDEGNLLAVVEPHVITGDLQDAVEKVGLFYPPDPASLRQSVVGGNVAENAGGPRAFKYGVTNKYVLGLEAVLPTGEIIKTGGKVVKNAVGYDLTHLLAGSEGTLAIITKIILWLIPKPPVDIPDDGALRLVFLPLEEAYSTQDASASCDDVREAVRANGSKPRYRGNRLVFVAPDQGALMRLRECVRTVLAWSSIIDDIEEKRLNIDQLQEEQAQKALETAEGTVPRAARECFKWLLNPVMASVTDRDVAVEKHELNTSGPYAAEIARVCQENEVVVSTWSPIHLRSKLRELYWKDATVGVRAAAVWGDMQRYLYMPRLKQRGVLEQAIVKGAASKDFFGTAYSQSGDRFEGFKLGDANVQLDDTLLLIEPAAAAAYEAAQKQHEPVQTGDGDAAVQTGQASGTAGSASGVIAQRPGDRAGQQVTGSAQTGSQATRAKAFFGAVDVNATTAKMKLVSIAEEIIAVLAADPNATVQVTLEISAEFPSGASDQTKRTVSENATALGFKSKSWE